MASIWIKILVPIDLCNKVIQARNTTLDVEVRNINSLLNDLKQLREHWPAILAEAKLVASQSGISYKAQ